MTETEVYDFVPQVPMVPCKAVGQAPAAVVVPMVPGKAVGQALVAVAVPTDPCKAVARRMADNFVDSCMPSVFPPADRLLIIDYAFIRLSCIIGAGI